jgi:hypothetical protein
MNEMYELGTQSFLSDVAGRFIVDDKCRPTGAGLLLDGIIRVADLLKSNCFTEKTWHCDITDEASG